MTNHEEEITKPKKRVTRRKRSKPALSPAEIEPRYQEHLEKIKQGGK